MEGVTVTFFSASLRALAEQHKDRAGSVEKLEELRRHLADAERVYREMTVIEDEPRGGVAP